MGERSACLSLLVFFSSPQHTTRVIKQDIPFIFISRQGGRREDDDSSLSGCRRRWLLTLPVALPKSAPPPGVPPCGQSEGEARRPTRIPLRRVVFTSQRHGSTATSSFSSQSTTIYDEYCPSASPTEEWRRCDVSCFSGAAEALSLSLLYPGR